MVAPKKKDHRTDGWRTKWLTKKKKEAKMGAKDSAKAAAVGVKGLRRAAKKGKAFEFRKVFRKLATEREKEGGGDEERIAKWTKTMEALKKVDLDTAVAAACAAMPEMDDATHKIIFPNHHPAPALPEGADLLLTAELVKEQLRIIAAALDPQVAQAIAANNNQKKKGGKVAKLDSDDECEEEHDSGSDGEEMRRRKRLADEWGGDEDGAVSEPEDVDDMIGAKKEKNRPGQRTRRKLILQQYGKQAKVFQAERDRKRADEGGTGKQSAVDEKLHPSWAAKNKEKQAIAAALAGASKSHVRLDKLGGAGLERRGGAERVAPRIRGGGGGGGLPSSQGKGTEVAGGAGGSAVGGAGGAPRGGAGSGERGQGRGKPSKKDKPLHPSWEAKKQAKERAQAAGSSILQATPRVHIKFDD